MSTGALEPVTEGMLGLVGDGRQFSVASLTAELADVTPAVPAEAKLFPPLPKPVNATADQMHDLDILAASMGHLHLTSRRSLTEDELYALSAEADVLASALDVAGKRHEEIKEIIRVHLDVAAEEAGIAVPAPKLGRGGEVIVAATPRDQKGHYLLAGAERPFVLLIEGFKKGWEQRFSSGSPSLSSDALQDLLDKGEIDAAEFNGFTRMTRVLDDDRISAYIRKHPARGLQVLRAITRRSAPKASLYGPEL
jgi:hypothetical protein